MRAILLTSTFRRHVFVANTAAASCDLVGVWQEEKTFRPERYARDAQDQLIIERHFADRDASEERYFSTDAEVKINRGALHRTVPAGACSDPAEVALMAGGPSRCRAGLRDRDPSRSIAVGIRGTNHQHPPRGIAGTIAARARISGRS